MRTVVGGDVIVAPALLHHLYGLVLGRRIQLVLREMVDDAGAVRVADHVHRRPDAVSADTGTNGDTSRRDKENTLI